MAFSAHLLLAVLCLAALMASFTTAQEQHIVIDERNHGAEAEVGSFSHRILRANAASTGGKRHLIENGKRILVIGVSTGCSDPNGSPCGPESKCEQVNATSFICQNEFYYGCVAGCGPSSTCTRGSDMVYYCKCDDGYYRPQDWMPCRPLAQ